MTREQMIIKYQDMLDEQRRLSNELFFMFAIGAELNKLSDYNAVMRDISMTEMFLVDLRSMKGANYENYCNI